MCLEVMETKLANFGGNVKNIDARVNGLTSKVETLEVTTRSAMKSIEELDRGLAFLNSEVEELKKLEKDCAALRPVSCILLGSALSRSKNVPSLFIYHTPKTLTVLILAVCGCLSHMNSVEWPCSPWVLVGQWIEHPHGVWEVWVWFLLGTKIFSLSKLKIYHLYSFTIWLLIFSPFEALMNKISAFVTFTFWLWLRKFYWAEGNIPLWKKYIFLSCSEYRKLYFYILIMILEQEHNMHCVKLWMWPVWVHVMSANPTWVDTSTNAFQLK